MVKLTNQKLLLVILILLVCQAGLIYLVLNKNSLNKTSVHYSFYNTKEFYDEAYQAGKAEVIKPNFFVRGGIIPHHLLVKDKVSAFFQGIENNSYQTVILIGPNHQNKGSANVLLSQAVWQTPYEQVEPDLKLLKSLQENFQVEESIFDYEHSIYNLIPFIKKSFPKAKIVPIIIKRNANTKELDQLAEILAQKNTPLTLILASVDFSHNFPTLIADEHDKVSIKAIENFDFGSIFNLDLDSPGSIYTVLKYLTLIKATKSQLLWSTNSGRLINKMNEPSTSHNIFYFGS